MELIVSELLQSDEPIIRYKALAYLKPQPAAPAELQAARQAIAASARVRALLAHRAADGSIPLHAYNKWMGAHWVLGQLADVEYPAGDTSLTPLREQVLGWLFSKDHTDKIQTIDGRTRRCASQEGNALYAMLALGIADARAEELANRLMGWQWPDGGWNCDKHPEASHSSFHESFFALRALNLYYQHSGDERARRAAERTADIFLKRKLFTRLTNGEIIHPSFIKLHYPNYWHYDILIGLRVLNEAGLLDDPRCKPALDLLLSKRLPSGAFPAEAKHYTVSDQPVSNGTAMDWGPTGTRKTNEFVTVEALRILRAARMS